MAASREQEDVSMSNLQKLKDLHHLRMSFPNKPEDYLESKYYSCQGDMRRTMEEIAREKRGSQFQKFLMQVVAFFCCGSEGSSEEDYEYNTSACLRKRSDECSQQSRVYINNAKDLLDANNKPLADYYFLLAKFQSQMGEQAKAKSVVACLDENDIRNGFKFDLDVHYLSVKQAIQALDYHLDVAISTLKASNKNTEDFYILTGHGAHSPNGIPVVKPAVLNRLKARKLRYIELNPGRFSVKITKNACFTNDLTKTV